MATISILDDPNNDIASAVLSVAQAGNGDSTNIVNRGLIRYGGLLRIVNTAGATPTVTINIRGSADNVNWFNVAYATAAAPETVTVTAVVVTTTATNYYLLREGHPWQYLKLAMSANTNETIDATYWSSPYRQF